MRYLVGYSEVEFQEQEFAIVEAPTEADATLAFVRQVAIHEEHFLEHLQGEFAQRFWQETGLKGVAYLKGELLAAADAAFAARVRTFFGPHSEYADVYLDYCFPPNYDPKVPIPDPVFPDDMRLFIWLHSGYSRLTTVVLENIPKAGS